MKPYYEQSGITIYHGDCRETTEWLACDVLITDPPYGIADGRIGSHHQGGSVFGDAAWDDLAVRDVVLKMWGERPRAVFGSPRRLDQAPQYVEAPIVWDKGNSPGMGRVDWPFGVSYELIYLAGDGWSGGRSASVLRFTQTSTDASAIGHPTPKPVGLMVRLLMASSGVVADPFMGSGTTLVAAKLVGRQCVGIEIEERYCEIAANRLAQEALDFGAHPEADSAEILSDERSTSDRPRD